MRIILITQEEPFYLADNLNYLINNFSNRHSIVGAVVSKVYPFGKKDSFLGKIKRTYKVFGLRFFIKYAIDYIINLLDKDKSVTHILNRNNIPIIELHKSINKQESLDRIKSYNPDLLISIAGNQIFKSPLINLPPKGTLNLHTALLPKYRGLMPTFWVLKNNEKYTGVSVFFVDEGIDSGPIVVQKKVQIKPGETQKELIKRTKKIGMDAIIEAVDLIDSGDYELIPNNDEDQSYYSFPKREDVKEFYKAGKKFF